MRSPTAHHKGLRFSHLRPVASSAASIRLNAGRSAMTNPLVRIGAVDGESSLIRPSSHQQRRREDFRPRSTRLSVMSAADES